MEDNIAQPGQTVSPTPAGTPPATPEPSPAPLAPELQVPPTPPEPAPQSNPEPVPEAPAPEPPTSEPENDGAQLFRAQTPDRPAKETGDESTAVTWTASEFIAHAKSSGWYAALALAAAIAAAFVYLMTKDPVSSAVIIIAAIFLGIYAGHKPKELEYRLDFRGLTIGGKHFTFDQFRSFSVLPEGAFSSIVFMPLKRFAVPTTIYYAPEDEDKIVNLLSDHIPLEERGHDAIDRLMHKIHF